MRVVVSLAVLVTFIACVSCGKICAPKQWQGLQNILGDYNDYTKQMTKIHLAKMNLYYDAENGRYATEVEIDSQGSKKNVKVLELYSENEGQRYIVDVEAGSCDITKIEHGFIELCADDAYYAGDYYIGLLNEGYKVSTYKTTVDGVYVSGVVRKENGFILPIEEDIAFYVDGVPALETRTLSNLEMGIKDESVFDLPAECKTDFLSYLKLQDIRQMYMKRRKSVFFN